MTFQPSTRVEIDEPTAAKLMRLIDALEDNDDVGDVHANFDVDAAVLERVAAPGSAGRACSIALPAVLREEPRYRLLFAGQILSLIGDRITFIALPFAVLAIGDLGDLAIVDGGAVAAVPVRRDPRRARSPTASAAARR